MPDYTLKTKKWRMKRIDDESCVCFSGKDITVLEEKLGFKLPLSYRDFLTQFPFSPYFLDLVAPILRDTSAMAGIEWVDVGPFYGLWPEGAYSLYENYHQYHALEKAMARAIMPIIDASSGHQICIHVLGERVGEICFWDCHERNSAVSGVGIWPIASSFDEFLGKIQLADEVEGDFL